jgi:uncharacterized membrane protein YbhN (UPF0104 family)
MIIDMHWSKWPHWFRGGLLGVLTLVVIVILVGAVGIYICNHGNDRNDSEGLCIGFAVSFPVLLMSFLAYQLSPTFFQTIPFNDALLIWACSWVLLSFLVGALIAIWHTHHSQNRTASAAPHPRSPE